MNIFTKKEGILLAIAMVIMAVTAYFIHDYVATTNGKITTIEKQLEEREEEVKELSLRANQAERENEQLKIEIREKQEVEKRYDRTVSMMVSRGFDRRTAILNANKVYIYNYLKEKGMTNVAIAGIMGNIEQESRFSTQASNGSHSGICQWDHGVRWARLTDSQDNPYSIADQTEFMWNELNERGLVDKLNDAPDIYTATYIFDNHYEGSGGYELSQRVAYANKIYQAIA